MVVTNNVDTRRYRITFERHVPPHPTSLTLQPVVPPGSSCLEMGYAQAVLEYAVEVNEACHALLMHPDATPAGRRTPRQCRTAARSTKS